MGSFPSVVLFPGKGRRSSVGNSSWVSDLTKLASASLIGSERHSHPRTHTTPTTDSQRETPVLSQPIRLAE